MNDEHLYAKTLAELRATGPIPSLWAKAFAESNGDIRAAEATYLRLRVSQLQAAEKNAQDVLSERLRSEKAELKARDSEERAQRSWEVRTWLFVAVVLGLAAVFGLQAH